MTPEGERLQKVLARAGVGSRRAIEELITAGRIRVNGRRAELGVRVDPTKDEVEVDGSRVPLDTDLVHFVLNKPEGVIVTADDPHGRNTALELVDTEHRVWTVGRLDAGTEGVLLVTNDGALTQALTHPSREIPKTYVAHVGGTIPNKALDLLARGVELDDGPTAPATVKALQKGPQGSLVEITITEGRNRQVRRMFEAVGYPVKRLVRTSVATVSLGRLRPGTFRRLGLEEVRSLYRACGL
jgi:23S rRNA pseudouridine2605 synthase